MSVSLFKHIVHSLTFYYRIIVILIRYFLYYIFDRSSQIYSLRRYNPILQKKGITNNV